MLLSYISTAANLTGVVPLNKCYSGARSERAQHRPVLLKISSNPSRLDNVVFWCSFQHARPAELRAQAQPLHH